MMANPVFVKQAMTEDEKQPQRSPMAINLTIGLILFTIVVLSVSVISTVVVALFGPSPQVTEAAAARSGEDPVTLSLETTDSFVRVFDMPDDEGNAVRAELSSVGEIAINQPDDTTVALSAVPVSESSDTLFALSFIDIDDRWNIGITQNAPVLLAYDGSAGPGRLDFREATFEEMALTLGDYDYQVFMPMAGPRYTASIDATTQATVVRVPDDTALDLSLDLGESAVTLDMGENVDAAVEVVSSGGGGLRFSAPDGAAVRIEIDTDSISTEFPDDELYQQVDGGFQTAAWGTTDTQILVRFSGEFGALQVVE